MSCDASVRAQLFDGDFGLHLLRLALPLLLGSLLTAWAVQRWVQRNDRATGGRNAAPVAVAGALLGLGMGGFLDGIFLHQVLQWHQMMSNQVPPVTLTAKNVNMFWDGIFHIATWGLTVAGVVALWRLAGRADVLRSSGVLLGSALLGWGAFNLVDSCFNHYLFGYHNVREVTANRAAWNFGFLLFGLAQLIAGIAIVQRASSRPRAGGVRAAHAR
ncbi:MAG TPA: DUF2243 domain-containing protein [Polyangiaceae bacterium]|nr:DUF2243 domain-containing protein [Polyangiaceae bacterium]